MKGMCPDCMCWKTLRKDGRLRGHYPCGMHFPIPGSTLLRWERIDKNMTYRRKVAGMSLIVSCKTCGVSYDMDLEPPLADEHISPAGQVCVADHDTGWSAVVTDLAAGAGT